MSGSNDDNTDKPFFQRESATNDVKDPDRKRIDYGEKDTLLICLDGTLSDYRHRLDLRINDYNWNNFHEAADKDPIFEDTALIFRMLTTDFYSIVYTTRPERYRAITMKWLHQYHIYPDTLLMKQYTHNYAKDEEVKVMMIREEFANDDHNTAERSIIGIFENDRKSFEALRNRGLTVFSAGA